MYNCCNNCGSWQANCITAMNILRQIANLVCADGQGYCHQTNGCCQTARTGCGYQTVQTGCGYQTTQTNCGCENGYPVSGRIYVSQDGWCNGQMQIVLSGANTQTATPYTTNYGQNGVYGGMPRRCGCAFNTLNS